MILGVSSIIVLIILGVSGVIFCILFVVRFRIVINIIVNLWFRAVFFGLVSIVVRYGARCPRFIINSIAIFVTFKMFIFSFVVLRYVVSWSLASRSGLQVISTRQELINKLLTDRVRK